MAPSSADAPFSPITALFASGGRPVVFDSANPCGTTTGTGQSSTSPPFCKAAAFFCGPVFPPPGVPFLLLCLETKYSPTTACCAFSRYPLLGQTSGGRVHGFSPRRHRRVSRCVAPVAWRCVCWSNGFCCARPLARFCQRVGILCQSGRAWALRSVCKNVWKTGRPWERGSEGGMEGGLQPGDLTVFTFFVNNATTTTHSPHVVVGYTLAPKFFYFDCLLFSLLLLLDF